MRRYIKTPDDAFSRCRPEDAAQHPDGRRLAGTVGTEESENLAFSDTEGDVVDRCKGPESLREVLDFDA
jgi:hypothetical protein